MSYSTLLRSCFVLSHTEIHRSGCCYNSCEPHHFRQGELAVPFAVKISPGSQSSCICDHLALA